MYFAGRQAQILPHWALHFGIAGVFGIAVLDASPLPFPIPGGPDAIILILGANGQRPWLLGLASIVGSLLGGYLTWKTGKKGGEAMLEHYVNRRLRSRITRWTRSHGIRTVAIATMLPPPMPLMPFLLTAGALGVTRRQLLIAIGIGRTVRYGLEVALVMLYGKRILHFIQHYLAGYVDPILYGCLGLLGVGIGLGLWQFRRARRRHKASSQKDSDAAGGKQQPGAAA